MLVGERMSKPVITVPPDMPINEALNLMKSEHIRRLPVVKDGQLIGIVSNEDLLNASPSQATSLSIWEVNYLVSRIKVKDVMTREVHTVTEDTPIEEAARIMADQKIGGLPVIRGTQVVGMITETDLFKIFLEFMGARERGVRVTALMRDEPGQLAKLAQCIAEAGGNIISIGSFYGESPANRTISFKVAGVEESRVRELITDLVERIIDIRVA